MLKLDMGLLRAIRETVYLDSKSGLEVAVMPHTAGWTLYTRETSSPWSPKPYLNTEMMQSPLRKLYR